MTRLVDQMLDFNRLRGQPMTLRRVESDLVDLAENLIDEMSLAYPGSRFAIERVGDTSLRLDSDRIAQVLSNLVGNARHHGAAGRPIRLTVSGLPREVRLEVFNEGRPIPPDVRRQLFTPFERQAASDRHPTGLGLGLYITHQIVEAHGGHIDVDGDSDGTCFRVRQPRSE